jgi:hypothetical protein
VVVEVVAALLAVVAAGDDVGASKLDVVGENRLDVARAGKLRLRLVSIKELCGVSVELAAGVANVEGLILLCVEEVATAGEDNDSRRPVLIPILVAATEDSDDRTSKELDAMLLVGRLLIPKEERVEESRSAVVSMPRLVADAPVGVKEEREAGIFRELVNPVSSPGVDGVLITTEDSVVAERPPIEFKLSLISETVVAIEPTISETDDEMEAGSSGLLVADRFEMIDDTVVIADSTILRELVVGNSCMADESVLASIELAADSRLRVADDVIAESVV